MSAALNTEVKTHPKHVHLSGFARWRSKSGNAFAPCGALIGTEDAASSTLSSSTAELADVTCPVCREQAAALGRAYAKARRTRAIRW